MNKYKIYLFTFPNNKKYCGYTSQKLERRWNNGQGYIKCPLVYSAIQKYGWNNIKKEIIFTSSNQQEAYDKEKEIIQTLDLTNPKNGYNLDEGGRPHGGGRFLTESGRQKISETHKQLWANPEYRAKMLDKRKNNKPSQLCIDKSRIATSKRRAGVTPTNTLSVCQLDKSTGEIIAEYVSASHAALAVMGNKNGCSNILNVCRGKRLTAYGYKWRFTNEK